MCVGSLLGSKPQPQVAMATPQTPKPPPTQAAPQVLAQRSAQRRASAARSGLEQANVTGNMLGSVPDENLGGVTVLGGARRRRSYNA